MSHRKIVIAAGGTGGHVFPALSLAHQLEARGDSVLFVGGGLQSNSFFEKEHFAFRNVSCGRPTLKTPAFPYSIAKGILQSICALRDFRPNLLIGFGSYYTLPVLIATRLMLIPYVIHEQNSIPGRVNRLFTKSARLTAIHFPSAENRIKGNCRQVAMPLRPCFKKTWGEGEAKKKYGLNPERPVLLVFGGSQGAEAINRLLYHSADGLSSWQVLHFTGNVQWKKKLSERYRVAGIQACVKVFEADMAQAWEAADLVVSRAGAVSIAEQLATSVPGILIPYPYATDHHQDVNADFLVELEGAVKLSQNALTCDVLLKTIDSIFSKLNHMRNALKAYKKHQIELIDCLEVV